LDNDVLTLHYQPMSLQTIARIAVADWSGPSTTASSR